MCYDFTATSEWEGTRIIVPRNNGQGEPYFATGIINSKTSLGRVNEFSSTLHKTKEMIKYFLLKNLDIYMSVFTMPINEYLWCRQDFN